MTELRAKVKALVRSAAFPSSDAVAEICDKTAELAADRILALPEIAWPPLRPRILAALGELRDGMSPTQVRTIQWFVDQLEPLPDNQS